MFRFHAAVPLLALFLLTGCFETPYSLGPADAAVIDPAYCGDWNVQNPANPASPPNVRMFIRNIDGKRYFVQWTESAKDNEPEKTLRMTAFTADVNGVTFAHLRDLPEDGSIPEKHLVMRVSVKDGVLTLRHLNEKFFAEQDLQSDADLRRIVEQNLDNEAMYTEGAVTALRAAGK
jgi:hypothetical protein